MNEEDIKIDEKYYVRPNHHGNRIDFYAVKKGLYTVAGFFCDSPNALTEEQARAGAEAYCNHLNEEYRNERN